jgi:Tol biopolymer transport system component
MGRRRLSFWVLLAGAVAALPALGAAPAGATFPGPNGRIAFSDYVSGQTYAVNPDGSALRQLTHTGPTVATDFPSWSPNGRRILFTRFRTDLSNTDNSRIWIMNADGANKRLLADDVDGFRDYTPKFTPDASKIVFTRCQPGDGVCAIWKMRADGTQKHALTPYVHGPSDEAVDFGLSVSPDGKRVVFTRFFSGGFLARLVVMRADGSDPHAVTPPRLEAGQPDWSPSGHRIVFNSNAPRNGSSLFTMKPDGSEIRRLTPDRFPHNDGLSTYSPQGNRIAYTSDRNYPDACCLDLFGIEPDGTEDHLIDTGLSEHGILWPSWGTAPLLP